MPGGEAAEEYHSKDFEWDQLRQEIEADPSLRYHLLPLHVNADDDDANSNGPSSSSQSLSGSSSSPSHDSEAWNNFHARHSSGKFFKVSFLADFSSLLLPSLLVGLAEDPKNVQVGAKDELSRVKTLDYPPLDICPTKLDGSNYLLWSRSFTLAITTHGMSKFIEGPVPQSTVAGSELEAWTSQNALAKERRYLLKEFPELLSCKDYSKVLEVGCGNGSTVLPILRGKESITVYSCDCCHEALERAQEMIDAADLVNVKQRFHPFLCDFSISGFPQWLACEHCREFILQKKDILLPDVTDKIVVAGLNGFSTMKERSCCLGGVDFVTLIFTLSAVPLHRMPAAIAACFSVLKPGGLLLFRDYGLYDMTMLRFEPDKKVGFREYIRSDGTRSYFFCLDTVRDLFVHAGFNELELEYCCVKSVNRRKGKSMQRVWVHGKFQKSM